MRNTVLKKLMTLALSACLILGSVPMAVHAEAPQGISDAQVQAFLSRSVGTWVFPVEEHFYEKISDYCGCRSSEEDPFYHMRRDTCQYFDHSQSAYGSAALHIDVTADGTPVMAPADGTVYRASYPDTNWGSNAVIEKQADSGYSYYIILGGLSADGPVASGTPVSAGTVVGYTQGYPLMLACVMDVSGLGNQLAGNLSGEMSRIQAAGWLADAVGTGMINVNPSMSTVSAYMHPFVSFLHGGVTYTFAVPAAPVQPTEAPTEAPTETQHEHTWDGGVVTVQPAEGQTGTMTYTCTICGEQYAQTLDALAHSHTFAPEWTYDENGHWHASACGHTEVNDGYGAHSWDGGVVTVQPAEGQTGTMTYTCTVCGAQSVQTLDALVHNHTFAPEWTYDENGHWHASTCGHTEVNDGYGAHSWDGGVVTVQPAEGQTGTMTYTCTVCGAQSVQTLDALVHNHTFAPEWTYDENGHWHASTCGHTEVNDGYGAHSWDGGVVTVQPAEGQTGTMTYTCTVCGAQSAQTLDALVHNHTFAPEWTFDGDNHWHTSTCGHTDVIDSYTPHSWDAGFVEVQPTDSQPGNMVYTCTTCGAQRAQTLEPVPHEHSFAPEWTFDGDNHWHAAACGHTEVSDSYGPHSWDGGVVTVQPTENQTGTLTYTCTVCGAQRPETLPPVAHQHTYADVWTFDNDYHWHAGTCGHTEEKVSYELHTWDAGATTIQPTENQTGTLTYTCTVCGAQRQETLPPVPVAHQHTFAAEWSSDDNYHWHAGSCGHPEQKSDYAQHTWDQGTTTVQAGHNVNGEVVFTCTLCGKTRAEVVPGMSHVFDQQVASDQYLKSAATCTYPAVYFKSCQCGAMGTETFNYGEVKGHTYSESWSYDETQHWQAATCEHTGERIRITEHTWDGGVVTVQPTETTQGERVFTCVVCGASQKEVLQPSTHQHTFAPNWSGNETYHWHAATCGHTSEMSDFGVHAWNGGVSTNNCEVLYTCQSCGAAKRTSNHNYSQMIVSDTYLKSYATCTTPAVYYYSCACGARGTETFTSGTALGHSYSGTWTYDSNSHWRACAACGTKLELSAHYYGTGTNCQTCGYARKDSHIHTSHLTRVPAKTATCTASGNVSYYTCSCGKWFTDVTAAVEIVDHNSVVTPAAGHVDKDSNGRCDLCREQIAVQTVTYTMTEGADTTWLNNSSQGLVFRCNADFAKFDHVEVDGSTISSLNYTVSNGSTIVELSASYMKRLAVGQHKIAIVSSDGRADASFSIKQGSGAAVSDGQSGGGSAVWTLVAGIAVVAMIAAAIVACYILYTNKPKKKKGGKFAR